MKNSQKKYNNTRLMLIFIVSILSSLILPISCIISLAIISRFFDEKVMLFIIIFWLILIIWLYHFKIIEKYIKFVLIKTKLVDNGDLDEINM